MKGFKARQPDPMLVVHKCHSGICTTTLHPMAIPQKGMWRNTLSNSIVLAKELIMTPLISFRGMTAYYCHSCDRKPTNAVNPLTQSQPQWHYALSHTGHRAEKVTDPTATRQPVAQVTETLELMYHRDHTRCRFKSLPTAELFCFKGNTWEEILANTVTEFHTPIAHTAQETSTGRPKLLLTRVQILLRVGKHEANRRHGVDSQQCSL